MLSSVCVSHLLAYAKFYLSVSHSLACAKFWFSVLHSLACASSTWFSVLHSLVCAKFYLIQSPTFIGLCKVLSDSVSYIRWPVQSCNWINVLQSLACATFCLIQCHTSIGLCKVLTESMSYIHWPVQRSVWFSVLHSLACAKFCLCVLHSPACATFYLIQCLTFVGLCKVLLSQPIQLLLELGGLLLLLLQRCLQVGPLQRYPRNGVALLALRAAKALAALHTAQFYHAGL